MGDPAPHLEALFSWGFCRKVALRVYPVKCRLKASLGESPDLSTVLSGSSHLSSLTCGKHPKQRHRKYTLCRNVTRGSSPMLLCGDLLLSDSLRDPLCSSGLGIPAPLPPMPGASFSGAGAHDTRGRMPTHMASSLPVLSLSLRAQFMVLCILRNGDSMWAEMSN